MKPVVFDFEKEKILEIDSQTQNEGEDQLQALQAASEAEVERVLGAKPQWPKIQDRQIPLLIEVKNYSPTTSCM